LRKVLPVGALKPTSLLTTGSPLCRIRITRVLVITETSLLAIFASNATLGTCSRHGARESNNTRVDIHVTELTTIGLACQVSTSKPVLATDGSAPTRHRDKTRLAGNGTGITKNGSFAIGIDVFTGGSEVGAGYLSAVTDTGPFTIRLAYKVRITASKSSFARYGAVLTLEERLRTFSFILRFINNIWAAHRGAHNRNISVGPGTRCIASKFIHVGDSVALRTRHSTRITE
jgi:hypothetical protein